MQFSHFFFRFFLVLFIYFASAAVKWGFWDKWRKYVRIYFNHFHQKCNTIHSNSWKSFFFYLFFCMRKRIRSKPELRALVHLFDIIPWMVDCEFQISDAKLRIPVNCSLYSKIQFYSTPRASQWYLLLIVHLGFVYIFIVICNYMVREDSTKNL